MDKVTLQLLQNLYAAYKRENKNPLPFDEWMELVDKGDLKWKPKEMQNKTLHNKYKEYVQKWYASHDEGEPACFAEWYDNEYQEEK